MSDLFQPIASEQLIEWVFSELESRTRFSAFPVVISSCPLKMTPFRTTAFGQLLETPFGRRQGRTRRWRRTLSRPGCAGRVISN